MCYYIAGYNDKYRTISSYYIGMREKQVVRNVCGATFYAGFYVCFRGSLRETARTSSAKYYRKYRGGRASGGAWSACHSKRIGLNGVSVYPNRRKSTYRVERFHVDKHRSKGFCRLYGIETARRSIRRYSANYY